MHHMIRTLVRKQVYLTREQERRLRALAGRRRRPAAELIREALDRYLGLRPRSASVARDPLWDIVGCGRSGGGVPQPAQDRIIYTP